MGELGLLVVHGLAVKTHGGAEAVADLLGEAPTVVEEELAAAMAAGLIVGAKGTYMVTPVGRTRLDQAYPSWFADFRSDEQVQSAADKFERINRDLLALLTDWQSVSVGGQTVPNAHDDPEYDRAILDRLGDLHDRATKLVTRLAQSQPRLQRYLERLDDAYSKALAGEHEFVSGVRVPSYHVVWHELHEDLLRMLGRSREE